MLLLTILCQQELCTTALDKWNICKIAIAHALGVVEVSQVSVVVAVSSAHRKEALEVRSLGCILLTVVTCAFVAQACHWVIDELKATTPIWKKEHFEDGSVWKENAESRALHAASRQAA